MSLPHYIQKAVDMDLLQVEDGKVVGCNKEAVETIFGAARLVEKLQPTTAAKMDDTTDQEAIALCRVLSSPSGKARHLWSELRVAFGIGHGQNLPANLWSNDVFRAIGNEIDRTFLGERDSAIISRESLISQYSNLAAMSQLVPTIEFNKTVSELGAPESMNSYGDAKSEWDTALDLLRQHRVRALYRETLSMAEQVGRTDSKLEKNIEFLQSRSMECLGMLRGSIGQQGNFFDMTEDLFGTENHQGFLDIIANANAGSRPVSTGVLALDIDMEGGIRPVDAAGGGRLFTLAARTGEGKTQLGVQIAAQAAVSGLTAGFISAELDRPSIYARLWASVTAKCDCDSQFSGRIMAPPEGKKGEIQQSIMVGAQAIQDAGGKLLVEAPWGADVDAVISTMRSMKAKNPELRLVILDHFHCLARHKGAPSNESAMMEERAYKLMTIAKEIDIDLVILAQMNRVGMDTLSAKQPATLDQIRGTDALSHVSHAVWILRKQMHDNDQGERASTGNLELWHAKVRGRQAYWNERSQSVDGVSGFIDKSVIRIHHPTSSIFPGKEGDDTLSRINEKASF